MCDLCRYWFQRELGWLVMDYVTLKTFLPSPVRSTGGQARHTPQQSFGHPAQDASDACREIAWLLNRIEAGLRDHVGDRPAPQLATTAGRFQVGHHSSTEGGFSLAAEDKLVNHAHTYLRARFEQLCDWPDVGHHAGAVHDTHDTNRAKYGLNRQVERLPLPCPSCDVAMLVRDVGKITCENCGREIREVDYPMLERIAIDWKIDEYESEVRAATLRHFAGLVRALAATKERQSDQNAPT
jgi:hypothetical protein